MKFPYDIRESIHEADFVIDMSGLRVHGFCCVCLGRGSILGTTDILLSVLIDMITLLCRKRGDYHAD